jgi:glycosyltransferase 2 family protein
VSSSLKPWYQRPAFWIGVAASLLCITLLAYYINLPDLTVRLRSADLRFVALGTLFIGAAVYMRAMRWQTILGTNVNYWKIFHAENIGYLINSILPIRAGEPARAYLVSVDDPQTPFVKALSTVLIDRVTDMIGLAALLGIAFSTLEVPTLVRTAGNTTLVMVVIGVIGLAMGAYARSQMQALVRFFTRLLPDRFAGPLVEWADGFLAGLEVIRSAPRLAWLIVSTTLVWGAYVAFYHCVLLAFEPAPSISLSILATCATALSMSLPSSPGFIGVFHAAIVFALKNYIGADDAAAYAIVLHALDLGCAVAYGIYSLAATGNSLGRINLAMGALIRPRSEER